MPVSDDQDVKQADVADKAADAAQDTSLDANVDESTSKDEVNEEKKGPTGWIPKVRLDEVITERESARAEVAKEREDRIRLEERLAALERAKETAAAKPLSRVQLKQMVDNAQITQEDADEHWAKQIREQAVSEARQTVRAETTEALKLNTVVSRISEFTSILPAISQRGTPEWTKASQEYSELCDLHGMPKTELQKQSMMLTAVKAVYGSPDRLKREVEAKHPKQTDRETVMDTTSTQKRPTAQSVKDDPINSLTPQQKAHYEKMFQKTDDYPNQWEDVRKELLWKRPNLARRAR